MDLTPVRLSRLPHELRLDDFASHAQSHLGRANQLNKYEGTPNRFGGWKGKGICLPNAVNCDINMPIVAFTEFSGWGGTSWTERISRYGR